MQKRRPADLSDYWEILIRRRWWIVLPTVLITGATMGVAVKLPKIYRSETLILVEPQKVPTDYVKATVSTDVTDRLQNIRQEILSRTRLQRIINQFGLYHGQHSDFALNRLFRRRTQEDAVELMRKDIDIDETGIREGASGAFKISYEGRNPVLVQEVIRQIASTFIEENLKLREQQAEGTDEFIKSELEKAREALETQERRLKDFKAAHMGTLPEQQGANLQVLGQLQSLLQANADALARAQEQKAYLQSLLGALGKREAVLPSRAPLEETLAARRAELMAYEHRYTAKHPDIVRLRDQVRALEKQSEELSKTQGATNPVAPSDALDQTRSQIAALDQEIKQRNRQQTELESKINRMQARIETLPTIEQQLSKITRDYEASKANYESLLAKKHASSMAVEMERRAKGEQFRILDPASYPEKPYKPNLAKIGFMGFLAGILCGCGLGFFVDYRDESIRNEKDLGFYLALPVLGFLPWMNPKQLKKSGLQRKKNLDLVGSRLGLNMSLELSADRSPSKEIGSKAAPPCVSETKEQSEAALRSSERLVVLTSQFKNHGDLLASEQFRIVRTRLLELMRGEKRGPNRIKTLLVTSAVEGEGKTLIAANLAFWISQLGLKVLLVDADLRKASLGGFLKISPQQGLSTYLLNGRRLADVRCEINTNLAVVPTLSLKDRSAELLDRGRMQNFLHEATETHDLAVLDTAPILPVADTQVLASIVDCAILVVRAGRSPYKLVCQAADLLKPKAIGVVLNGVERIPYERFYYGYHKESGKRQ